MLEIDLPRMESLSPEREPPSPIPQLRLPPEDHSNHTNASPSLFANKCGCKYIDKVS